MTRSKFDQSLSRWTTWLHQLPVCAEQGYGDLNFLLPIGDRRRNRIQARNETSVDVCDTLPPNSLCQLLDAT